MKLNWLGSLSSFANDAYVLIVNAGHPGKASWQILPKLDHGFALHETFKDAVAREFVGPFGEQVVQRTVEWMQLQ